MPLIEPKVRQDLRDVEHFGCGFGIMMLDVDSFKILDDKNGQRMGSGGEACLRSEPVKRSSYFV